MLLPEVSNEDADLQSFADVTSEPGLPAATRLDRLLVRATEAALDTTDSNQYGASNANNRGAASQLGTNSTEKGSSHSGSDKQQQQQNSKKKKSQRTLNLTQRMRSLFGLSRGGGSSSEEAKPPKTKELLVNRSNRASKPAGPARGCRRDSATKNAAASLGNASNVAAPAPGEQTAPAAAEAAPPNAETSEAAEAVEPKAEPTAADAPPPDADGQTPTQQPTPSPTPQKPSDTSAAVTPTPVADEGPKKMVLRGGPTTAAHKRVQDAIFRECRIVPIATMYKKVAMVPGRERLFFGAASNPRTVGSRMLYDIAYENFRHHTDCNRDFARVGLKKICSSYCRPSQFRYVY